MQLCQHFELHSTLLQGVSLAKCSGVTQWRHRIPQYSHKLIRARPTSAGMCLQAQLVSHKVTYSPESSLWHHPHNTSCPAASMYDGPVAASAHHFSWLLQHCQTQHAAVTTQARFEGWTLCRERLEQLSSLTPTCTIRLMYMPHMSILFTQACWHHKCGLQLELMSAAPCSPALTLKHLLAATSSICSALQQGIAWHVIRVQQCSQWVQTMQQAKKTNLIALQICSELVSAPLQEINVGVSSTNSNEVTKCSKTT